MAVTETIVWAGSDAGGVSDPIVVSAGQVIVVVVDTQSGAQMPSVQCALQRQVGGNYRAVRTLHDEVVFLTADRTEVALDRPGTYRLALPPTPGLPLVVFTYA